MSKPSLTNCPKLAAAPAARGVPAQSWYNDRCMNQDVPLQQELQPLLLSRKYLQVQLVLSKRYSGGYSVGDHLFPFRTEKLSPTAPMVLHTRGRVGRRQFSSIIRTSFSITAERGFFCVLTLFQHSSERSFFDLYAGKLRHLRGDFPCIVFFLVTPSSSCF